MKTEKEYSEEEIKKNGPVPENCGVCGRVPVEIFASGMTEQALLHFHYYLWEWCCEDCFSTACMEE